MKDSPTVKFPANGWEGKDRGEIPTPGFSPSNTARSGHSFVLHARLRAMKLVSYVCVTGFFGFASPCSCDCECLYTVFKKAGPLRYGGANTIGSD